jgi:hypothetical protein
MFFVRQAAFIAAFLSSNKTQYPDESHLRSYFRQGKQSLSHIRQNTESRKESNSEEHFSHGSYACG